MSKFFIALVLSLLFAFTGCHDCDHNNHYTVEDPAPVLTVVWDGEQVVIAAHSQTPALLYRQDDTANHMVTFTGAALIYDSPCPGAYTYVLEVVDTQEMLSEDITLPSELSPEFVIVGCRVEDKVEVCHKGRVIRIARSALDAHLAHGDIEGTCPPELPDNDIDDDLDGLTDCEDPDLVNDPSCIPPVPEDCANSLDDDGDGKIDCADEDCATAEPCLPPPVEDCANGVDDDGDGIVDCDDPDCASAAPCQDPPVDCVDNGWNVIVPAAK